MNNIMFLASTQNQHSNKRSPRPESPGGYFTLSDSDGGSNPGTESSSMDDLELPSHSKNSMYKMYTRGRSEPPRGSSGGSERSSLGSEPPAPQRPSPPKIANEDDDTPPRPPPPLSYTSTLPPPVPKKVNKRINPPNVRRFNPPPPPLTHFGPKTKPLQRVQPLQIQSPSMIQMLQPKCGSGGLANNSTSSSDDNSLDGVVTMKKPVTFVTTFQRATSSMKDSPPNLKTRPPLKCEQQAKNNNNKKKMSSRPSSGTTTEVAGYMKPTKTAVLKQNNDINGKQKMSSSGSNSENESDKNKKKTARRSASSSSSLSDTNTSTETESSKMTVKKKTRPKTANDGNNNTSSKLKKLKNSVCNELKRSASDKAVPVRKTKASSIKSSLSKSEANVNKGSSKPMKNPIHSLIKFYESSQEKDKMKEKMVVLEDKLIHENKMDRMSSTSQLSQLSQMSAEKIQTWLSNPLSMTHDEFSVTDISILDQYVTDMISLADVTPNVITNKSQSESDDDYPRVIKKSDLIKRDSMKSQNKSPKSPRSSSKVKSEKSSKVTDVKEKEKSSKSLEKSPKSTKVRLKSQKVNETEKNRSSNASSKESKKPPSNITPTAEKSPSNVCDMIEKIFTEVTNNVSEKFPKVTNVTDVTERIINVKEKSEEIIDVQPSDALIKKWQNEKNQLSTVTKHQSSDSANHNSSDTTQDLLSNIIKHQSSDVSKDQPTISNDSLLSNTTNKLKSPKSKPKIAERYNLYNKDYSITEKNTEITVLEDKIPSEEEIQRGCFTEVSCAGNVTKTSSSSSSSSKAIKEVKRVDFAPIPSPRVKKKARKEQMLLEHKEKGHDALAMVMKHLTKPEDECSSKPEHSTETTELATANDGLQCLDDLCSQSRFIEEDIKKQAKITDEPTKNQNDQPKEQQQKEEVGVCLIIVFLICHSDHLNQSFKGLGS